MKKRILTLFMCLVLSLTLFTPAFAAETETPVKFTNYMDRLEDISELIREYHLLSSVLDYPLENALNSYFNEHPEEFVKFVDYMLQTYDKYSHYMTPEDYGEAYSTSDSFVGIGVSLDTTSKNGQFIESVFPGSPAEKAGLRAGDEIVYVDGADVSALPFGEFSELIRGEENTAVKLGVRRRNVADMLYFDIVRAYVEVSNIVFADLGDGVAYIRVVRFGDINTFLDFFSYYYQLPYMGFRSLIVDVRDNPGGALDVLLNMLDIMIPEKGVDMFSINSRDALDTYRSRGSGWDLNEIVVLVNENSASASEVFAGSLQKNGLARVVGAKTYGKGVGQYHFDLDYGDEIIITNFEILLPDGKSYNGVGITPDEIVPLRVEQFKLPEMAVLNTNQTLRIGDNHSGVLGLEQRLKLLGYLTAAPDSVFDADTAAAVQAFQQDHKLRASSSATAETLSALVRAVTQLEGKLIVTDTQLERAFEIAKEAAKKPLSFTPPVQLPLGEE
ncbi:MAG: peptidoglycan-binding protein [Oscillospiraceae bacterium]|jgi:carboxyl-terminal processing protease|nr:peptidoglycan-binding protein [Oscillospiraceae bacterium]